MAVFCITFSLQNKFRNYDDFYEGMKSSGTWWHQHDNVWFISSSNSAEHIRDYLLQFIDNKDKLFVFEVGRKWAAVGHKQTEYDWVNKVL